MDGALTRAVQHGGWVLLDNANLVNPTVLDRLNALLEPGGSLYLPECGGGGGGGGRVIDPHPDFRLILAMDPRHGEVSRAMRNRGIEVCLLPPSATNEQQLLVVSTPAPAPAPEVSAASAAPPLSVSWPAGVSPDPRSLEAAVRSGGASVPPFLAAAMSAAHSRVEAACHSAHRRAPTAADLSSWSGLTMALLQRGRALPGALAAAWEATYSTVLGLPPREAAVAKQALQDLLEQLGSGSRSVRLEESAADASLVTLMDIDDDGLSPPLGHKTSDSDSRGAAEDEDGGLRAGLLRAPEPSEASAAATALAERFALGSGPSITVPALASDASLTGVLRDAALLDHLVRLVLSSSSPMDPDARHPSAASFSLPCSALAPWFHGGTRPSTKPPIMAAQSDVACLLQLIWASASLFLQVRGSTYFDTQFTRQICKDSSQTWESVMYHLT